MHEVTFLRAIHEAQREELQRSSDTVIFGQDLLFNLFGTAEGFLDEFGPLRVRDVPLSEAGFVGTAIGAAMTGLRPIVDMTMSSFLYVAMDQLVSQAAKNRYVFGGQTSIPVVFRAGLFYGGGNAAQHSDRPHPLFMNTPGLKVIMPSTPRDAKGLLKAAIRDDNPVISFEDCNLWSSRGPVSDDPDEIVPLGVADVRRPGTDATLIAIGGAVAHALTAAEVLAKEGVSVEVIDPRTLVPMDWDTLLASATRTGRVVVADTAHKTCSAASEIAATIVEEAFSSLRAPIVRVTAPDVQVPFSQALEPLMYPTPERIAAGLRRVCGTGR